MAGRPIVTSWYDYPAAILGYTERPLLDWFMRNVRAGESWLDIGAHYGYTAVALSVLVGAQGRVFAFEPSLATAGCLAQTRRRNGLAQLVVLPYALGAEGELRTEVLPESRGMVDATLTHGAWSETFAIVGLDWLWPRICGEQAQIHGVKIDVQGMEVDVLRGMFNLLRTHQPKLVVEVHSGVSRPDLLDILESAGYDRKGAPIEPVEGEIQPLYADNRSYAFQVPAHRAGAG